MAGQEDDLVIEDTGVGQQSQEPSGVTLGRPVTWLMAGQEDDLVIEDTGVRQQPQEPSAVRPWADQRHGWSGG